MNSLSSPARWRALALLSAIFGAGVSVYLLVEYTTGQAGVCLTGSGCDEVRTSDFAYPMGIPLPVFGVAFYFASAWLAWLTLGDRRWFGLPARRMLVVAALGGAAFSALLTGIEAFVIHAFCTWCLASAAASVVLLVAALGLWRAPVEPPVIGGSSRAKQQRQRAEESERSVTRRVASWSAALTVLLFSGLLIAGAASAGPGPDQTGDDLAPAAAPRLGTAPVTVVEFADFQCPACAVVGPVLQSMAEANELSLVFRYFPLESIHANANSSARAAEAARLQGFFWPMAEALYARQAAWANLSSADADAYFAGLAGQLGMDVDQWRADYVSGPVRDAIARDVAAARDLNLSGTPMIFIGGELYEGDWSAAGFRAAVQAAEARQSPAS